MTLLAGDELKVERFFKKGNPRKRASSFDLTVGHIYDDKGREVEGPFILRPNEMVQVASAEVFELPPDITAHVSYKTSLTSQGVWALTVGIVDPGWNCPISTTLLNFSKVDFPVDRGTTFLRVSFFQHAPADRSSLHQGSDESQYARGVAATAGTRFGRQFLNVDSVAKDASDRALRTMKENALSALAVIAVLFTVLQLVVAWGSPGNFFARPSDSAKVRKEIFDLRSQLKDVESRLARATSMQTPKKQIGGHRETPPVQGADAASDTPPSKTK